MRVSDDRYNRDRMRFDLAVRMLHHEARTCTIRAWTGLSDDRIRKLYRAYLLGQHVEPRRRHRGKAPQQVEFFLRSGPQLFEATSIACLFDVLGLLSRAPSTTPSEIEGGERFCDAYETYITMHESSCVTFEHASFLMLALWRRDELDLVRCNECARLFLHDVLSGRAPRCDTCRGINIEVRRRRRSRGDTAGRTTGPVRS